MGQTIAEKIVQRCAVGLAPNTVVRTGDFVSLRPHHVLTHDNTSAVIPKFVEIGAKTVAIPAQPVFALDHDIQNTTDSNRAKYAAIEAFACQHGITFYPAGHGIGHQVMVENGHVLPGALVVASDSHANMYGALGALGTPVVRTDAAAIWATGEFWWVVPPSVRVELQGQLRDGVSGKDVILTLCGHYRAGEVLNSVVEFVGSGIGSLSMDARLTIANMTTEWGALAGWFPVDDTTVAYLTARHALLASQGIERFSQAELDSWCTAPPHPDDDADYVGRITLDLSTVEPFVAGPDSVQRATALSTLSADAVVVDKAYLLSCVNSRYEDLEAAARVLEGKTVHERVTLYVAAASEEVQKRAEQSGIWQVFVAAGARFLPPGCGPCIGLGEGLLRSGEVGISATNRNFKGRMGAREARCYLASPQVVAASAIEGRIAAAADLPGAAALSTSYRPLELPPVAATADTEIAEGFASELTGRLLFLPVDNLNTDGIYGKDYTYREDMTPDEMARVVMENYDPLFAQCATAGDIVVGGDNFGTGSSREQAVTALSAKGIRLVIAASFSQTYLRNAFNNGFICLQSAALVQWLRSRFAPQIEAGEKTIVAMQRATVDFRANRITVEQTSFGFPALSPVAQALVLAGGVENLVRRRLSGTGEK